MKLFVLLSIAALCGVHCSLTKEKIDAKWKAFKVKYGRTYTKHKNATFKGLSEEALRKSLFTQNCHKVEAHNAKFKKGLETYKVGINKFSDLSDGELKRFTHGLVMPAVKPKPAIKITSKSLGLTKKFSIPASVDWKKKGMVTPVKYQGDCGSCWAFASIAALESHVIITKGSSKKVILSEQQIVDCDRQNGGCNGGWPTIAFEYMKQSGVASSAMYPYVGLDGRCTYKRSNGVVKIQAFAEVANDDERIMAEVVATKGPVAVAIDASGNLARYQNGVYYNPYCQTARPTHAVLVVGYGSEGGRDYWLVKNSWGADWGDDGYIKMARNRNNNCGIAMTASFPIL